MKIKWNNNSILSRLPTQSFMPKQSNINFLTLIKHCIKIILRQNKLRAMILCLASTEFLHLFRNSINAFIFYELSPKGNKKHFFLGLQRDIE